MAPSDNNPGYPVQAALDHAVEVSRHSWEYGTTAQALLEHYSPELSIFSPNPLPSGQVPRISDPQTIPSLAYASKHISTTGPTLSPADKIGVADPCNLGVSALLLGQSNPDYLDAARRQINFLHTAPRLSNRAISHRTDVSEAWADFVYMLPPFLAYAAVTFYDVRLLHEAFKQCELYRELLIDDDQNSQTRGLWRHIKGEMNEDKGFWSTSCGWAAAGMARVLVVLVHFPAPDLRQSEFQGDLEGADEKLTSWIIEILDGAMRTDDGGDGTGLLRNYLAHEPSYFPETAGTALLASVVYRMTALAPSVFHLQSTYVKWAEEKRKAVAKCVDEESGISWPTCQSTDHKQRTPLEKGEINPEGQCFLVMLGAAWRDWRKSERLGFDSVVAEKLEK